LIKSTIKNRHKTGLNLRTVTGDGLEIVNDFIIKFYFVSLLRQKFRKSYTNISSNSLRYTTWAAAHYHNECHDVNIINIVYVYY